MNMYTFDNYMVDAAIESLKRNGTFAPNIDRVVFNLKTEEDVNVLDADGNVIREPVLKEDGSQVFDSSSKPAFKNKTERKPLPYPILATTVYFRDNTKVTVKNSSHDPITVIDVKLDADGNITTDDKLAVTTVKTADSCSKERAISYAILKRLFAIPDVDGNCAPNGLGRILTDIVSRGFDQNLESVKAKLQKTAAKKRHLEKQKSKSKPKSKRYSNADVIQLLGPVLERLNAKLAENPNIMSDVIKALSARD